MDLSITIHRPQAKAPTGRSVSCPPNIFRLSAYPKLEFFNRSCRFAASGPELILNPAIEPLTLNKMYRSLKAELIIESCRSTQQHIALRFPGSGLSRVAAELHTVSQSAAKLGDWLSRPNRPLRILAGVGVVAIVGMVVAVARQMKPQPASSSIAEFLQGLDAALNEIVFIGIAGYFLLSLETRLKRHRALNAIHELRSMAHIIDMHQLTKDPERPGDEMEPVTDRSGDILNPAELIRYLNHCSDLLALISKLSALYVQRFNDPVTLSAVNEVENLTNGLSRKIWQKIMIFDRILVPSGTKPVHVPIVRDRLEINMDARLPIDS